MGCSNSGSVKEKNQTKENTKQKNETKKINEQIEVTEQKQVIEPKQINVQKQVTEQKQVTDQKQVTEQKQTEQKQTEQKKATEQKKDELKIEGPIIIFPEDNIESVSFTPENLDLKKLREIELEEHNYLRSLHGAPPLKLNEELNEMAQKYAQVILKLNTLQHSKTRELKGKKGEWVGENLYASSDSSKTEYHCGSMSKAWYSEIENYDFKTGQSTGGVIGHFTQLVWNYTKEVGFGIGMKNGIIFTVANYYPGGNFNNLYLENVGNLIPRDDKTCKELFQCESARKNEFELVNKIRKIHNVSPLVLDDHLNKCAMEHAEMMGTTGTLCVYDGNGKMKNWTCWEKLILRRGYVYKGGESVKKWYNKLKEYDFEKCSAKNKNDSFYVNMGVSIIWKKFTKIGIGYYFQDDNTLYSCAIFDQYVYSPQNGLVFPASNQ